MVVTTTHRGRAIAACFGLGLALGSPAHAAPWLQIPGTTPSTVSAPLPETEALLKAVIENLDKVEAAREDYTATKTVTDREVDGSGRVMKTAEKTFHCFYLSGRRVEKLVAENGQPLASARAAKEEARIAKIIRENEERKFQGKADEDRRRREGERKREAERKDDDEPTAAKVLRLCRFVNGRREIFRGREVLTYDFEPRRETKAQGRLESWIQKMVGRVWIDEAARHFLRLEARLTDSLKVAGGLFLSVSKGSSIALEQELVRGEVWLPTLGEVNVSARFLLLKGFKNHQTQRFSDYRKFAVDTTSEVRPPKN